MTVEMRENVSPVNIILFDVNLCHLPRTWICYNHMDIDCGYILLMLAEGRMTTSMNNQIKSAC
jgi:hypothetical protein